jgi:uroporphyrin-III C-methyltransferase|mmetsp:Transcript_35139/g.92001  ORF Transcript_35139/g.92001 Transcript_35139/m.92001 type:complete len:356 (-) Transcript_35139:10-1077(-)
MRRRRQATSSTAIRSTALVVVVASLTYLHTRASAYLPISVPQSHHLNSFVGHRSAKFRPPYAVGKDNEQTNEWGIPYHTDLPPLGFNTKRPPKALPNGGRVTLVGSGPGDPDLLTVAAYKLLTSDPDALVVADRLVSPEILALIPGEVKVARKLPGCAELAQEEIYWWCYQGLNQGRHVIRLKIGDPFVFGRGGEEILAFRDFGVEAAVVPGVSSAFSAPLLGGIPVTHRGVAQQVVMCTGYGREGSSPDLIQYHKEQTVVFLMAVGRLRSLCDKLIELAGYPRDTPVAIVEKAGCPEQRTVVGNMMTIADIAEEHKIKPPSVIVVGEVVNALHLEDEKSGMQVSGLLQNYTASS